MIAKRDLGLRWITRDFQEKAAWCPSTFLACGTTVLSPTTGRRTVLAFPPTASIADSPYFHPHSLRWQLGVLNLKRVLPSLARTGYCCFPATSFLARVALTRTRRLGQTLSGSHLLSRLP